MATEFLYTKGDKPAMVEPSLVNRFMVLAASSCLAVACVPPGNSSPYDAGAAPAQPSPTSTFRPSEGIMREPFEDNFDRKPSPATAQSASTSATDGSGSEGGAVTDELGPDWMQTQPGIWHIEGGRLCGRNAHNKGVWLNRVLPVNARIEFDAIADSPDGDLKAEVWGDGRSSATSISYTNATSYLTIFGGWKNKFHVLARLNEHATDRKQIVIDPNSDDPLEKPVVAGQIYHFKIERTDGKTVRWSVDDHEYLRLEDPQPLAGAAHDHFGFNDWEVKVCFDNVRVTPL
jgi:hypothetical protein